MGFQPIKINLVKDLEIIPFELTVTEEYPHLLTSDGRKVEMVYKEDTLKFLIDNEEYRIITLLGRTQQEQHEFLDHVIKSRIHSMKCAEKYKKKLKEREEFLKCRSQMI